MTEPETLLQHAAFLRGLARGLLGDADRAGDVVQQTWLAALEKGPRTPDKARAWLATTLRNFVRMSYRGQSRRRRREEAVARPEGVAATDSIAEKTELQRNVADAVHTLEEPYRATIVLRYLEEHSAAEIAARQGVPVKTVQTRLRRGLELLRGRLDATYGGDRKKWALLLVPLAWPTSASAATASAASTGATAGVFWMLLMKPKIVLPVLLALVVGSAWLVRETWSSESRAVERTSRVDPAPTPEPTPPSPEPKVGETPVTDTSNLLLRGIVRDPNGVAVSGAVVTPGTYRDNERWQPTARGVTTDSDGAFSIAVARDSGTGVSIVHPDYVPHRAWLRAAPAKPRVITLRFGALLTVLVHTPDGRPVERAQIDFGHQKQVQPGTWSVEDIASAMTGEDGRTRAVRVPRGRTAVLVAHADFAEQVSFFDVTGTSDQTVVLKHGGSVTGRVVDRRGKPIAGATVRDEEEGHSVRTDQTGRFRLETLEPGWIELVASAEGFGAARHGEALGWHEAIPVPVRNGETTRGVELVLPDATWLSGRIVDEKGKPVPGFPVAAWVDAEFKTKTDADGRFRFALGVSGRGTASISFLSNGTWDLDHIDAIELREGESRDLGDLRAVTLATIAGRVVDEDGKPVASGWVATATNLVSIRAGRFGMQVHPGAQQIRVEARSQNGPLVAAARTTVAPGERVDDLVITAQRAGVVRVRLVNPDGSAADARWVMAVPVGAKLPAPFRRHAATAASRDGTYELHVAASGKYRVGILDRSKDRKTSRLADDPPPVITTPGDDAVTLVVPLRHGIVTGQVTSGSTRQPIPVYEARLVEFRDGLPWNYSIITARDPEGRFRFNDAEGGGTYAIEIAAKKHGLYRSKPFSVNGGQTITIPPITLEAEGFVRGRVIDAAGRPVPFARISVLGPNLATNVHRPVTDAQGRFDSIPFAPGEHRVVAFHPSRGLGLATVEVGAGQTAEVEIAFARAAPLRVVVTDAGGKPASDVSVTFGFDAIAPLTSAHMFRLYLHGHTAQTYRTNSLGELRIPYLPAGDGFVSVGADRKSVTLAAGVETTVEFQLE